MKNTKFDNILDDCLERLLAKGETVEECLASYPEQAAVLKPLLETALIALRVSAMQPRPEFRARARYQFHAALQGMRVKRGFLPFALPRWATVVAVALVLLVAGGGTVATASTSMPDEPLYPVKLATEQVQLAFTPTDIRKAEMHANLANKRVAEIVIMASKGDPERLEKVTQRFNTNLIMVAALARALAREEKAAITKAPALAPAPELAPLSPDEAGRDNLDFPKDERLVRLRMAVARYAIRHPAMLRARLETAPESARPALRRAIAIAEARYRQVLEAVGDQGGDR